MQVIDSKLLDSNGQIKDEELISELRSFYSSDKFEIIQSALALLQSKSTNSTRHPTGISSFLYAIEMAYVLFKIKADEESVAAGILYELYNFADISEEDVQSACGDTVVRILQGTRKMSAIRMYRSDNISLEQIDTFRKMLLTIIEDVRIVLVKIVDKLCTIRHLKSLKPNIQQTIARETLDIYAPLANRLGLGAIKWELEDRAFFFLDPNEYKKIASSLGKTRIQREQYLEQIIFELKSTLKKYKSSDVEIQGRVKHIYSIYKKFKNKGYSDLTDLFDITAIRVIANNVDACYKILAEVNNIYSPLPEEFSDYIANPKSNGYKSIHTVVNAYGENIEIQIRTHHMHEESELGFAAHWRYKEGVRFDASYEARVAWLRSLLEWEKEINNNDDIDSSISKELNKRIYVFTPANELIDLSENATVLDFAYSVHTMVGHRTKGAKINGKIVPLTTSLKTGDRVEIMTAKEPNPSKDWATESLGYLTSARNRSRVTKWFNEQNKDDNIVLGKDRLLKALKGYDLKEVDYTAVANGFNIQQSESLFACIESGAVRIKSVINHIIDNYSIDESLIKKQQRKTTQKPIAPKVLISGYSGMKYELAKCCQPTYPEYIEGYMSVSKGVVVHTGKCPNLSYLKEKNPEKFIEVSWKDVD